MKNLSKEKRDQLVLVGLGAVLVAIGLWYFLLSAQNEASRILMEKIARIESDLDKAGAMMKKSEEIQRQLHDSTNRLASLEARLPGSSYWIWASSTLDSFLESYSNRVEKYEVSQPTTNHVDVLPKFPYMAVKFGVEFRGFYHDVGHFLAGFENNHPYIAFRNLTVSRPNTLMAVPGKAVNPADAEKLSFKCDMVAIINMHNPNVP